MARNTTTITYLPDAQEVKVTSIDHFAGNINTEPGSHSDLKNLDADDHPQYLTETRGNQYYASRNHSHSGYAGANHLHTEAHITNLDKYTKAEVDALVAGGQAEGVMIWKNKYTPDQYEQYDVVIDGEWTMVANKQTTDRAAPQPIGDELIAYSGSDPTVISNSKSVTIGMRVSAINGGYINNWKLFTVTGNSYSVYTVVNPTTTPVIKPNITFTATSDGWQTFYVQPTLLGAGTIFDLLVVINQPDPTPDEWEGDWAYTIPNNQTVPAAGQAVHANKASSVIRFAHVDDNGGDRQAELEAMLIGDVIHGPNIDWAIQSVNSVGSYVEFGVAPATQDIIGTHTFGFETVELVNITYLKDVSYWSSQGITNIQGLEGIDVDYTNIVPDDNAYGINITYQEADVSDDWDLLATSEGAAAISTGSGGGGGGGGIAPYVDYMTIAYLEPSEVRTFEIIGDNFDENTTVVPRVDEGSSHITIDSVTAVSGTKLEVTVTTDASFVDCYFDVYNGELLHFGTGLWIGNYPVSNNDFELEVNMTNVPDKTWKLPLRTGFTYNFTIYWGDGTSDVITAYNQAEITHVYPNKSFYQVKLVGICEAWYQTSSDKYISKVYNLGHMGWKDLNSAFASNNIMTHFTAGDCDTSAVVSMNDCFSQCSVLYNLDVSTMDTSSVTSFESCFLNVPAAVINTGSWDTSSSLTFKGMFQNCIAHTIEHENFSTPLATNFQSMFSGTKILHMDVSNYSVGNLTDMSSMFNAAGMISVTFGDWSASTGLSNMNTVFQGCSNLLSVDLSSFTVDTVSTMTSLFTNCTRLHTVVFGNDFNSSSCTGMGFMFSVCYALDNPPVTDLNTSALVLANGMFNECTGMTTIDVTGLIGPTVENTANMFDGCRRLAALDISSWDMTNVTNASSFLRYCGMSTFTFAGANLVNANNLSYLCTYATIESIDLTDIDVSKVVSMANMFQYTDSLVNVDTTGWVTTAVTNLGYFAQYSNADIDVSHFDIGACNTFTSMMQYSNFSQRNYDLTLTAWAAQSPVSANEAVHFGTAKYSPSKKAARDILDFAPNNWTLYDGGVGDELVTSIVPGDGTTAWQGTSTHTWGEGITTQTEIASAWYKGGYFDSLPAATDGEVFCKGDGTEMVIGLTIDPNTGTNANNLDFALYFKGTTEMWVTERNGISATLKTTRISTDEFSIRRTGSTIEYLKNGTVFYTSLATINIDAELSVDTWTHETNHNIHSIRLEV